MGDRVKRQQILERLVGFDTTSHLSNVDLIAWIEGYLHEQGVQATVLKSQDGQKANLIARIGPDNENGVVLSGHTDVVPVTGQAWSSDPFQLERRGSRLYGRGTADMKGFIACVLAAVPKMKRANLSAPVHLAFSHDEEVGCLGVRDLIPSLPKAAAVIVGEPTELKVVDRHKGVYAEQLSIRGVAAHSSLPHLGVNAIDYACALITEIRSIAEKLKAMPEQDFCSEPNFTTLSPATISGGTAMNIVPNLVDLSWHMRAVPRQDPALVINQIHAKIAELETAMQKEDSSCAIEYATAVDIPPFQQDKGSPAVALCQQLSGQNATQSVNYGTEAGLFQRAGYATAVSGPGNIAQAHKPDEFIELAQLDGCDLMLEKLIEKLEN